MGIAGKWSRYIFLPLDWCHKLNSIQSEIKKAFFDKHLKGEDAAVFAGVSDTFPVAVETASKNRTVIQVGWPPKPVQEFLNQKIMDKYLTINGTWACPMNELEENVKAVEDGIVDLDLLVTNKDYTLDRLENAIHDLETGKILGRATISIE